MFLKQACSDGMVSYYISALSRKSSALPLIGEGNVSPPSICLFGIDHFQHIFNSVENSDYLHFDAGNGCPDCSAFFSAIAALPEEQKREPNTPDRSDSTSSNRLRNYGPTVFAYIASAFL